MNSLVHVMNAIEAQNAEHDEWCTLEKAQCLASLVIGLRCERVVEIGVWEGGSFIPMALALAALGRGKAYAIDPWSADASIVDENPANVAWWQAQDHGKALATLQTRVAKLGIGEHVEIVRAKSSDAPLVNGIGLLHIDGNHNEQAVRDVERWAPLVIAGGILVLDDLAWTGGNVGRAYLCAEKLGFLELYKLGSGCVMQRIEVLLSTS